MPDLTDEARISCTFYAHPYSATPQAPRDREGPGAGAHAGVVPAGQVVEAVREEPEKEARRFKLTDEGEAWVEAHAEELLAPTSREEIADLAQQGYMKGQKPKTRCRAIGRS